MEPLPLSYYQNRLRDFAWRTQLDERAAEELICRLVVDGPEGATELLVDVLEGCHGKLVGSLAYRALETGMHTGNGNPPDAANAMATSFAEVCMFKGRLAMLHAVLDIHPRDSSAHTRSLNKSDFLDHLCSTAEGRQRDPTAFGDGRMEGLVGLAAQNWRLSPHARAALDMAWGINPEHPAWGLYFDDPSGPGAFVREYLMSRQMEGVCAPADAKPGRTRRSGRVL